MLKRINESRNSEVSDSVMEPQVTDSPRSDFILSGGTLCLMALILVAMGRPVICTCGTVKIWQNAIVSSQVSQHLMDWYTLTHVSHGLIFYAIIQWLAPELPVALKLMAVTSVEAGWEILENTDYVIKYYRQNTMAVNFTGDSIINSVTDVIAMILGFQVARRSGFKTACFALVGLELIMLYFTRDGLFLNLLMLMYPIEGIQAWQMAPVR